MKFKIFNIEISISVLFCVLIAFLLIVDSSGLMSISLLTVVLHEFGHLICMKRLNCSPKALNLSIFGIFIVSPSVYSNNKEKALVAISGPIVNLITCVLFLIIYSIFKIEILLIVSAVNLLYALFNLLPIVGLDGGTVMQSTLIKIFGVEKGKKISVIVSFFTVFIVITLGVFILINNIYKPTLLLLGIYLFVLNILKL